MDILDKIELILSVLLTTILGILCLIQLKERDP
jgi:hypothetical protein